MGQSTNDMFPTAIHVAVGRRDQERPDSGAANSLRDVLAEKAKRVGQDHQDRPHAPGRRHAAAAGSGDRRLRPADRAVGRAGQAGDRSRSWNCPPAARRSARASTRIPSSAAAWPQCWPRKRAFRSSKRSITSKPTPSATAWSSATASCGRSPSRCSTSRTTSAGSAAARAAGFTKSSCPTASRAARSCRAR